MIDLLLSRSPRRRPESARQVRDALRRMAHGTLAFTPMVPKARPPRARPPRWALPTVAVAALTVTAALLGRAPASGPAEVAAAGPAILDLLLREGLMRQVRRDRFRATTKPRRSRPRSRRRSRR